MAKQNINYIDDIVKTIYQTCDVTPSTIKAIVNEIENKEFDKLCDDGDWVSNGINTVTLKSDVDGFRVIGVLKGIAKNGLVIEDTHEVVNPKDLNLMPLELLNLVEKVRKEWERL